MNSQIWIVIRAEGPTDFPGWLVAKAGEEQFQRIGCSPNS